MVYQRVISYLDYSLASTAFAQLGARVYLPMLMCLLLLQLIDTDFIYSAYNCTKHMVYQRVIPCLDYSIASTSFSALRSCSIHIYVNQCILPTVDHSIGEPQRCEGGHAMGFLTTILGGGRLSTNLSSLLVMFICMQFV